MAIQYRTNSTDSGSLMGLVARLDRLEKLELSRSLLACYASAVDAADPDRIAHLMTTDVRLVLGDNEFRGHAAVLNFFRRAFVQDPSEKAHFITGQELVMLEDGDIHISSRFFWTARGETESIIGWGSYDAISRVEAGMARFARLTIEVLHVDDIGSGWTSAS